MWMVNDYLSVLILNYEGSKSIYNFFHVNCIYLVDEYRRSYHFLLIIIMIILYAHLLEDHITPMNMLK